MGQVLITWEMFNKNQRKMSNRIKKKEQGAHKRRGRAEPTELINASRSALSYLMLFTATQPTADGHSFCVASFQSKAFVNTGLVPSDQSWLGSGGVFFEGPRHQRGLPKAPPLNGCWGWRDAPGAYWKESCDCGGNPFVWGAPGPLQRARLGRAYLSEGRQCFD